jgi:hypothetical protein
MRRGLCLRRIPAATIEQGRPFIDAGVARRGGKIAREEARSAGTRGGVRTPATRGGCAAPTRRLAYPSIAIKEKLRHFVRESLTRRSRHSSPHISFCPACPKRPLCSGDKLGAPDTVMGAVGRKEPLERAVRNNFLFDASQLPLGAVFGNAAGHALKHLGV